MARFYVDPAAVDTGSGSILITGGDVNHIRNVLRLQKGDILEISDGACNEYEAVIDAVEKDRVAAVIKSRSVSRTEPPIDVTLYQGIPKADKMDLIIQKCVELGISRIVPVITERTVVKFSGERDIGAKTERWKKISLEASKQCGRGRIPSVSEPLRFEKALGDACNNELLIIPYELDSTHGLAECLKPGGFKSVAVFIGPEGGFTGEEIAKAGGMGVKPVTLGPRILRTETAGLAVLSILMYELGDMG